MLSIIFFCDPWVELLVGKVAAALHQTGIRAIEDIG